MFYSQFILAKKGPLGTIWIAAHLERKLRKNQVADTDIGDSVDSILSPDVPIALRLSSHLLLGVVRIYSKKVNYLFDDCSEALLKVKQAFRSTVVDLPPEQSKAPYHSITLPETFDLDDFELPDNEMFQGNFVDHHVSTKEQITLQDTMDGVSYPTSQFGPDERFGDGDGDGDGDVSQLGLDLDEELFMDKGDVAGTSGILVGTDADPLTSTKKSSHSKSDEVDEEVSDPPLASNTNYFSIQAPSTPGLTEEPNLPSAKEEVQVSDEHMDVHMNEDANLPCAKEEVHVSDEHMDDHMDEDQNDFELVAEEVCGNVSSPVKLSHTSGAGFHGNGNVHYIELDNEQGRILETGSLDFISSGVGQPVTFKELLEANIVPNNVGIIPENERNIAADVQSKGCFDADKLAAPVAENAIVMELQDCDPYGGYKKTDVNGTYHPLHDIEAENNRSSTDPAVQGNGQVVNCVLELQSSFQPFANLQNVETSVSNIYEKSSGFSTPVLQACTSKLSSACDGVDNAFGSSNFSAQEDGSSFGTAMREGGIIVSGTYSNVGRLTLNVGDALDSTSKIDQITHRFTCAADSHLEGSRDNLIAEQHHFGKENDLELSNFPPPELLLSMPNLSAGPSHHFGVDFTPGKDVFSKDGDATDENLLSGRKRSFTESTLTFPSFYSVESGGAQSKGTIGFIPKDNDLLSSILGGRSTGFKMKPTPPVSHKVRAKRQRTAVRSVVQKRKLLIDDSTVLHGDTIRQQLTNTQDIRRVRKKAPCTHLEVWVLQKQFLEDGIFSESLFTGMFPALQSLDSEAFDLNGIRILRDDRIKEASEANISTRPTFGEDPEAIEPFVPSTADISTGPKLNEETEDLRTFVAEAEGLQMTGGCLFETPCEQEPPSIVDDSTLLQKTHKADDHVMNITSHFDVHRENISTEFDDMRTSVGGESMQSVALGGVPESSVGCASEDNYNSTHYSNIDSTSLNIYSDVAMPMHNDVSDQLPDQRSPAHCSIRDNSAVEYVSGSGTQNQGLHGASEKVNVEERSADEHVLDIREGSDASLIAGHRQDNCSLPDHDPRACPTTDQVECHLDGVASSNKYETLDSSLRHDGSCLASNNVGDYVDLNSSFPTEMDLGSEKTTLIEMEDPLREDDSKIALDSTSIHTELIYTDNAELGTDVIEHDTDFLNVDDDDVNEDYESDMPDPEEKRVLDNSGWSSRTRAVANYLQVLFEKEYDPLKRVVSLDNLLVGKTRKEASRMFFETLVLKTKDYIQTEQDTSFCHIKIQPRGKLLKSEFGSHT